MSTFGKRLKELRREKGLMQEELAQEIGVSKGSVSVWERNIRKPEYSTLQQLCEYFQVSLGYLLGEVVDRSLTPPSEENLAAGQKEGREEIASLFRSFLRLSPDMQDFVKQTIIAAYKFDKKRGALQVIDSIELRELADKISGEDCLLQL